MRAAQLAILVVFLVLWEVAAAGAIIINPLFTSYPSAIWPTFVSTAESHAAAGRASSPTPGRPCWRPWSASPAAMVLGTAVAAALWWWNSLYKVLDPYLVVANAMPKTAFVPIFYIWLGATHVDLRHVARDLAVHHHPDDLFGLPGHRPEQDQAGADVRRDQGANPHQGGAAGQRADADRSAQGECRPVAGRRRGRRIPVGQSRPRLSDSVRQPDLQDEHRDDRDHDPGDRVVADVSRDLRGWKPR